MLAGLLEWVLALRHLVPGGYYDFLLKHSRIWDAHPCPEAWARGAPRECYRNAGTLALAHPELTYVEGVATSFIPTAHAWCVTPDGQVVDPTWANPGQCAYLGIPFKTEFLKRRLVDTEVWGIIGEHIPPRCTRPTRPSFWRRRGRLRLVFKPPTSRQWWVLAASGCSGLWPTRVGGTE